MNLRQLRQSIGHPKTRIFGLALTDEPYGRQEMEQLAAAKRALAKMRQAPRSSTRQSSSVEHPPSQRLCPCTSCWTPPNGVK
jgi:hypothetical protein